MAFNNLPCEILEKIFSYLNGVSLARSTCVCSNWKFVIENVTRITALWRKCVLEEIPEEMLLDIVGGVDVFDIKKTDALSSVTDIEGNTTFSTIRAEYLPINWYRVYKIWFSASHIDTWNNSLKNVSTAGTFPVTCCKVSGMWVLTGHRNGSICSWDWRTGSLQHVVIQHLKMVTDFVLFDLFKNEFYGDPDIPFAHHHIVSVSKDHTIQVSPLFGPCSSEPNKSETLILQYHSDALDRIRAFGNSFAVSCVDKTISIWRLAIPESPWCQAVVEKTYIIYPCGYDIPSFMGFWKNQILCLCSNAKLIKFSKETNCWSDVAKMSGESQDSDLKLTLSEAEPDIEYMANTNADIFWGNTVFLFTIDRHLWVSIDGQHYHRYHSMEVLQSSIVCICLRAGLLAMGLERGMLALFKLHQPNDLLKLNLSRPAWCQQLSEASILSTDISENEEGYPIVIATTTESIFVINWKPSL